MKNIAKKIIKVQSELPKIEKNQSIPYGRKQFKYADLEAVMSVVKPVLVKNGLMLTQIANKGLMCTQIHDVDSDDVLHSEIEIPNCTNPQDLGKWITYIKRYALCSMLGIVAEDDDDGQVHSKAKPRVLTDERFQKAVKAIKDGSYTVEQLEAQYNLTDKQIETLMEIETQAA